MIKINFEDRVVEAPTSWEEVTVETFINPHFLAGDSISLLSALTGVDRKALMNSTLDIMDKINMMVSFAVDNPHGYRGHVPQTIKLRGQDCKIPKDIELERLGQKIMLQDAIARQNFVYQAIPDAIAIYLAPELNGGEFDDAMIPELREEVLKLKLVDVFPVADFFLSSLRNYRKNGKLF